MTELYLAQTVPFVLYCFCVTCVRCMWPFLWMAVGSLSYVGENIEVNVTSNLHFKFHLYWKCIMM